MHIPVVACRYDLAAGIYSLARSLVLLVNSSLCHICKIVVLFKTTVQLNLFMCSCLRHGRPEDAASANPVVTVQVGIIELTCTCSYHVQVGPLRHDFQLCYILLKGCCTLLHACCLIQAPGAHLQYFYRWLTKVLRFRQYCLKHYRLLTVPAEWTQPICVQLPATIAMSLSCPWPGAVPMTCPWSGLP